VEREELALAGKWCSSPRRLNGEMRICLIGGGQKRRSRRHRGVTSLGGRNGDGEPNVTGVNRNSSNQFVMGVTQKLLQSIRHGSYTETPPINSINREIE
jgi:hypothetical protein